MSHRKSDLGIPCPRKICQSSARACTHKSWLVSNRWPMSALRPKADKSVCPL